jgi:hypothetical protein
VIMHWPHNAKKKQLTYENTSNINIDYSIV